MSTFPVEWRDHEWFSFLLFLSDASQYVKVGCFRDKLSPRARALPELLANYRGNINWNNLMEVVEKCAKKAKEKNYMYFAWVLVRDITYTWETIDCRKILFYSIHSLQSSNDCFKQSCSGLSASTNSDSLVNSKLFLS